MERREFLGWMGLGCLANSIPHLLGVSPSDKVLASPTTDEILQKIQQINRQYPLIGIYHRPTDQDRASAGSGIGIFPCDGNLNKRYPSIGDIPSIDPDKNCSIDNRSEKIYLPFVMAPRRQTDSMVRQAYLLLPEDIRRKTAFLIADRLIQQPEAYIPYIQQKSDIVLIGSFFGVAREITNRQDYEADLVSSFHSMQLDQLEYSIELVQSLEKKIVDVVYAMGDSPSPIALEIRQDIETRFKKILNSHELAQGRQTLTWGADETTLKAFARQLPSLKIKVTMSNPDAKHHYDGNQTTKNILLDTNSSLIRELGFQLDDNQFDLQVFVFDKHKNATTDFIAFDDPRQIKFDRRWKTELQNLPREQHSKTVIIDSRNPNGALNTDFLPPSEQFLAFGSWGTFTNGAAQTLAMAKILHFAKKPSVQKQLLLEAIAHDMFVVGYAEAQSSKSPLRKALKEANLRYVHKEDSKNSPYNAMETEKVYGIINKVVNGRISKKMTGMGSTRFKIIPQHWRTFESQVFTSDGVLSIAGVYRKDLPTGTFDPLASGNVRNFDLQELLNEFI